MEQAQTTTSTIAPVMGTDEQVKRLTADWSRYAKEPVTVHRSPGLWYCEGSEIACLRIYLMYRDPINTRVGYSINLRTWFFQLEDHN